MGALPGVGGRRPETCGSAARARLPGLACSPAFPHPTPKMLLRPRRHSRSAPGTGTGPATRATAAARAPGAPPRAPGLRGDGPTAVSSALAARSGSPQGRREGPRGVDLAGEPLVGKPSVPARSPARCLWGVSVSAFSLWGSRSPRPPGEKGGGRRRRRRKGRRQRAAPPARHSRVAAERPPGSASSAPPRRRFRAKAGSGGVFSFPLLFCFQLLARPRVRPNQSH